MQTFADRYDFFVFDLDGTLADTREDLTLSVNRALASVGRPPVDAETITRFVGNGARLLIERALGGGASEDEASAALDTFIRAYREDCVRKTVLYPGVEDALRALRTLRDKPIAVLTNKPLLHTRKILRALGIAHLFRGMEGGDSAPAKKPDPSGLLSLACRLDQDIRKTLLVGDSDVDIRTARAAGADAAFVTYGYRPGADRATPPDYRIDDLRELLGPLPPPSARP